MVPSYETTKTTTLAVLDAAGGTGSINFRFLTNCSLNLVLSSVTLGVSKAGVFSRRAHHSLELFERLWRVNFGGSCLCLRWLTKILEHGIRVRSAPCSWRT